MKSNTGREWREIAYHYEQLAKHRGEALGRVWIGIDAMVDDADLANSLRLLIVGDFVPDLIRIEEIPETKGEGEEEPEDESS